MRIVSYTQTEFMRFWNRRKKAPLDGFIPRIPYGMFLTVVPGLDALNELLEEGHSGGGMSPGCFWEPFSLDKTEYAELLAAWQSTDFRKLLNYKEEDVPDISLIVDEEIMAISSHLEYFGESSRKYSCRFANLGGS